MDFIKKHFEKILLTGTLLVLIGVAGFLAWKIGQLSEEVNAGQKGAERERGFTMTPTGAYSNAMNGLKSPATWPFNPMDPFHTGIEFGSATVSTNNLVKPGLKQPFALVKITRRFFKLIFKSYDGEGENFKINEGKRTFIVSKVGDKIWSPVDRMVNGTNVAYDTGYVVIGFTNKTQHIDVAGIPGGRQQDISELTVQRGNELPIVLVRNKSIEEREPEAIVTCLSDNQNLPMRKGQPINCGGKSYNVVDIGLQQVVIVDDQTKEQFILSN